MKRILITGGSSFVGGHLIKQASEKYDVITTWNTHQYDIPGMQWQNLELTKPETFSDIITELRPDVVILNAAMTQVDACEQQRELAYRTNVASVKKWVQLAGKYKYRLIFVSSDMVYDGKKGNYCEDDAVNPVNYYGETKVLAEQYIRQHCENCVIARAALVYGTPFTNGNSFSHSTLQRINMRQSANLFFDQYRTPVLVNNLAQALLELSENWYTGTINLGGSQRINRYDFGNKMAEIFEFSSNYLKKTSMFDLKFPAERPRDVSLDISKATSILTTEFVNVVAGLRISKNDYRKLT